MVWLYCDYFISTNLSATRLVMKKSPESAYTRFNLRNGRDKLDSGFTVRHFWSRKGWRWGRSRFQAEKGQIFVDWNLPCRHICLSARRKRVIIVLYWMVGHELCRSRWSMRKPSSGLGLHVVLHSCRGVVWTSTGYVNCEQLQRLLVFWPYSTYCFAFGSTLREAWAPPYLKALSGII